MKQDQLDLEEEISERFSIMKRTIEKSQSDCRKELAYSFQVLDAIFQVGVVFVDNEVFKKNGVLSPSLTHVAFGEMMVVADRISDEILLGRYRAVSAEVRYVFEYLSRSIFVDTLFAQEPKQTRIDLFKMKLDFWIKHKNKRTLGFSNVMRKLNLPYRHELHKIYEALCQEIHPDRYFTHPLVVTDLIKNPQNYVDPKFLEITIEIVKDAYDWMFYMIHDSIRSGRSLIATKERREAIQKSGFHQLSTILLSESIE